MKEDYLKNNRIVNSFCKNQKIDKDQLVISLEDFNLSLEDTGKHSKTFEDYASHFLSWFRKKKSFELNSSKPTAVDKLNKALGI